MRRIAVIVLAAAAVVATLTGTAAAAPQDSPPPGTVVVSADNATRATWTPTDVTKYPTAAVRECYAASCQTRWLADGGDRLYWDKYAYNSSGNRWYHVEGAGGGYYGWIYCGNVSASC